MRIKYLETDGGHTVFYVESIEKAQIKSESGKSMKKQSAIALALSLALTGIIPAHAMSPDKAAPDVVTTANASSNPSKADSLPISPATPARGSVTYYRYDVIDLKKTKNWTNTKKQLGICKVSKGVGGSCSINAGYSIGTDVSVSLGATINDISGSVGFNRHYSANGSVSWTSPSISKKSAATYRAYAVGTKATYKIRKMKGVKALGQKKTRWTTVSTSGTLTAFSPNIGFDIKK
ncbi:hypothetical protein GA0061084_2351 [Arthrobacter sp. NIO-1057]|nr:hypothetical protein GA0061084_2351 [Arthrobacter sp. NIO-1057]